MAFPPKPAAFTAVGAPVGVEIKFLSFWQSRPVMTPRSQYAHTNGASVESSIEGQVRWAEAAPGTNTAPHYVLDRQGRARKTLPSDRQGIANATVTSSSKDWPFLTQAQRDTISVHGQIRTWSLAYETTDLGWPNPGEANTYTAAQGETLATIMAYESIVHGIPLALMADWWEPGTASHTDPFGYPFTTVKRGKSCPGRGKKADLRAWVLPRAVAIKAAWTFVAPDPDPPDDGDEMKHVIADGRAPMIVTGGWRRWARNAHEGALMVSMYGDPKRLTVPEYDLLADMVLADPRDDT